MPIEILMPALSPTMTEGNVARWLKKEGDEVHSGDVLAEIETDKATMEFEAVDDGRLGKILVPEGAQGIKVNAPIALLLGEDEDASALEKFAEAATSAASPQHPRRLLRTPAARAGGTARSRATRQWPDFRQLRWRAAWRSRRVSISPQSRGSGPQGRIVKADIEAALSATAALAPAPARLGQPHRHRNPCRPRRPCRRSGWRRLPAIRRYTERPLNAMRRVIARRLTESKQTVPHFYLTIDCEIDELLKIRTELNAKSDAYRISVNDFVIRAAALALRQVPAANASWSDEAILLWDTVDIAVAVALDDGLITPIVKNADRKGLATIANETKDLAARARAGKLKLEEFQGGTFSISNLGMFGVRDFAAVINPPHGGILAVGAGEQRAGGQERRAGGRDRDELHASCDHRAVDGAVGAQFLAAFKKLVEDPLTMLL